MTWLTPEDCIAKTHEVIHCLREKIDGKRLLLMGISQYGFSDSIGIQFSESDRDTYFISRTNIGNQLAQDNVVCWTHWVGRVTVQVRDFIERNGRYPDQLEYGPPGVVSTKAVGPWVRYQFDDGQLRSHTFRAPDWLPSEDPLNEGRAGKGESAPVFGLRDIVDVRDLEQDERIRGPMQGIYLLTGGPGVGKTTVALHRIAYLLYEQNKNLPPGAPKDFFGTRNIHVVVWKEHLVPYLEKCLGDLGLPRILVRHVEEWVARTLRNYIRFGKGDSDYQITKESEQLERMKLGGSPSGASAWRGLQEDLLRSFLVERDEHGKLKSTLGRGLQKQVDALYEEIASSMQDEGVPFAMPDIRSFFHPTSSGVESITSRLVEGLKHDAERSRSQAKILNTSHESAKQQRRQKHEKDAIALQRAADAARSAVSRMQEALRRCDLPSLLAEFYSSEDVRTSLATCFDRGEIDRFCNETTAGLKAKQLTQADRYLLMWVARILTKGKRSNAGLPAMEDYSHTVVDEAQYYEPIVLRLLVDLAKEPLCSMTIVGDLEQKVTSKGGVLDWNSAGIAIDPERFFRLTTNYRWTREIFEFLRRFRECAGIQESLREPRTWPRIGGGKPAIARLPTQKAEDSYLVDLIVDARRTDQSIAVVVPPAPDRSRWAALVNNLATFDVRARWADGEDVKECIEKVIVTDYESVVGLEFDAVFLPSFDCVVPACAHIDRSAISKAWVAMTRAKKSLTISHVEDAGLISDTAFEGYRKQKSR